MLEQSGVLVALIIVGMHNEQHPGVLYDHDHPPMRRRLLVAFVCLQLTY